MTRRRGTPLYRRMDRDAEEALWPPPGTVPRGRRATARAAARRRAPPPDAAASPPSAPLGDDDAARLWGAVARGVTPLPGRAVPPPPPPPEPPPPRAPSHPPPAAPRRAVPPPPADIAVGFAPPGLDQKRWNGLRRGKLRPERKLDLHGMRLEQAHAAVHGFLLRAEAEGLRCVCVVTGKGSSPEGGALRRELPHWLNAPALRPLVLAAAHPHSANTGAVHLLLRRRR